MVLRIELRHAWYWAVVWGDSPVLENDAWY